MMITWKNGILVIVLLVSYSCTHSTGKKGEKIHEEKNRQAVIPEDFKRVADTILPIASSKAEPNSGQWYFYPNMSYCGGALYGYYEDGELLKIESTYAGDLGFHEQKVLFENGKVIEIIHRRYDPDMRAYTKKYPGIQEVDPNRMLFTDTTWIFTFGNTVKCKQFAGKRAIKIHYEEDLPEVLMECALRMKAELSEAKEPSKGPE